MLSCIKYLSLGTPQGCVFKYLSLGFVVSPVLFSLYTIDCRNVSSNCSIVEYADDTVISSYLVNDSTEYFSAVKKFVYLVP